MYRGFWQVDVAGASFVEDGRREMGRVIQQNIIGAGLQAHRARPRPFHCVRRARFEWDQVSSRFLPLRSLPADRFEELVIIVRIVTVQIDQILRFLLHRRRDWLRLLAAISQSHFVDRVDDDIVIAGVLEEKNNNTEWRSGPTNQINQTRNYCQ